MRASSCSTWMTKGQWTQMKATIRPSRGVPSEVAKMSSRERALPEITSRSSKAGAVEPRASVVVDSVRDIYVMVLEQGTLVHLWSDDAAYFYASLGLALVSVKGTASAVPKAVVRTRL